jgi:alpha-galactosidase
VLDSQLPKKTIKFQKMSKLGHKKIFACATLLLFFSNFSIASLCTIKDNTVLLNNGVVGRSISFADKHLITQTLFHLSGGNSFIATHPNNRYGDTLINEFSFRLNDKDFTGRSDWDLVQIKKISDSTGGEGASFELHSTDSGADFSIAVNYLIYDDLPIVRKWIDFKNLSDEPLKLEAITSEDLIVPLLYVTSKVYHNYGRMTHLSTYVGNWDDPVIVVHDMNSRKGMALGNENIAVLKRTAYHTNIENLDNIEIGTTRPDQDFPFRKWLRPGENWQSAKVFIALYSNRDDGFSIINHEINQFTVRHLQPRIVKIKEKPLFVYNTWYPFRTYVNDSLIRELAIAAADCGIGEFIIDDGWQVNHHGESSTDMWGNNYGDWLVDRNKFKDGLKPTFDFIKSLGMKPGLWLTVSAATKDAKVFQEHPEYFVEKPNGEPGNVHVQTLNEYGFYTASFATDWYDYIRDKIEGLIDEHGLVYTKLDCPVVTSPYVTDPSISGSYGKNHKYSMDHQESLYVQYDRLMKLFDELHEKSPDLFIDCTYETVGKLQMMDYAVASHAEGNWLSNFEESSPVISLRIRQMAWWRSPAVPAASLVIGNLKMDDPEFELGLKSLIGTLPIVLGDPRNLSVEKRQTIKAWSTWMKEMQEKYNYMIYRKDLPGFGEPRPGHWDGWQRLNFETQEGGIFAVFRQGAFEDTRKVFLTDLKPASTYSVKQAPEGTHLFEATGKELMEAGFEVTIEKETDGKLFEVTLN